MDNSILNSFEFLIAFAINQNQYLFRLSNFLIRFSIFRISKNSTNLYVIYKIIGVNTITSSHSNNVKSLFISSTPMPIPCGSRDP